MRTQRILFRYVVQYAVGENETFVMKADGVPLDVTVDATRRMIEEGFTPQKVKATAKAKLKETLEHILQVVNLCGTREDMEEWRDFFNKNIFIRFEELDINLFDSYLHLLYNEFGGEMRRKDRTYQVLQFAKCHFFIIINFNNVTFSNH